MTDVSTKGVFEQYGPELLLKGWEVLPIAPGKKRPGVKGWSTLEITPAHVLGWAGRWPNHGVGIRLGTPINGNSYLIGIDVDVRDPEISEFCRSRILNFLGTENGIWMERIGMEPKTLIVARLDSKLPPKKQMSTKYIDFLDREHRIELLGSGQQFVAYGIHPDTKQPYRWVNEELQPTRIEPNQLALLKEKDVEALLGILDWAAKEYGMLEVQSKSKSHEGEGGFADYRPPKMDVTKEQIERALRYIDASDYNRWMMVGFALWHQFDGSDEGLELWDEWSQSADNYVGEADLRYKWSTMKHYGSGGCATIRSVLFLAREARGKESPEFPEDRLSADEIKKEWLDMDGSKVLPTLHNAVAIMSMDKELEPLWTNQLTGFTMIGDRPLKDSDAAEIKLYIYRTYGKEIPTAKVWEALLLVASRNKRHPVVDYLDNLLWDGTPRLDRWLTTYAGAEDEPWIREVGRKTLVAAVARAFEPGVKWDYMLILEGPQRTGKSSLVHALSPVQDWTADLEFSRHDKVMAELLQSHWIIEAGELRGLNNADIQMLKAFISRTKDTYRAAYARAPEVHPRQCIVIGTTNTRNYLRDATGNRRFIPVTTKGANIPALIEDRDQLWAEATTRYREGERLEWSQDILPVLEIEQQERMEHDSWEDTIQAYLDKQVELGLTAIQGKTIMFDCFSITEDRLDRITQLRLANIMRVLKWETGSARIGGRVVWAYKAPK